MDPVVTIDNSSVSVEPGGQATVRVKVRNRSGIVEGFQLDVVGEAAGWAKLYPPELEVRPQEEAETVVIFSPPSGTAARAGQVPFGVRAVSRVDPSASSVAEGDLAVGSVALSQATITPVTSKGRFSARHRIEMANWGNSPVRLALEVSDPDEAMGFLLAPDVLDLPIGTTGRAKLKLRARRPFFRGPPQRRSFRVVGKPVAPGAFKPEEGPSQQFGFDPTQPSVDGAFEQRPILGGKLIPLAIMAVVAAGVIGWLSTRGGNGPGAETTAPPTPEGFQAETIASESVNLRWEPLERVDAYKVVSVDPATRDDERPAVLEVLDEGIDSEQGSFEVTELEPGTPHCFQLAAVRSDVDSDFSDPVCVETAQQGAPAPPSGVAVEAAEEGTARVSWTDESDGAANHVVLRDGSVVQVVEAPVAEAVVETGGENCFQVASELDDVRSASTPEPCIPLEGGDGGGSNGGGGGGGGGGPVVGGSGGGGETTTTAGGGGGSSDLGVIAVVDAIPIDDVDAQERALAVVEELQDDGHDTAALLDTSDYPALANPTGNFFYVYVPGFGAEDEAQTFCTNEGFGTCLTYDLSSDGTSDTTEP